MRVIALAGYTGAGKTALLRRLACAGAAVLDLEALAHHRGSAFGATDLPQPTPTEFAARIAAALHAATDRAPLWIEDAPPFLGRIGVPAALQAAQATAPIVVVTASPARRLARLVAEYGTAPAPALHAAVDPLRPRLGHARADAAHAAITRGALDDAPSILMPYYDAAYDHRAAARPRDVLGHVETDASAEAVIALAVTALGEAVTSRMRI